MAAKEFVDFAAIREELSIETVAKYLGLRLTDRDQAKADCPACDSKNALAINKSKGKFFCHSQESGGDCIALVAHVKGIRQLDAAKLLQRDLLGNGTATEPVREHRKQYSDSSRRRERQEDRQERQNDSAPTALAPLDYLEHEHDDVQTLGFSAEDAEALGIGYAGKRGSTVYGFVAIPVRLPDGTLAGYIGIPPDAEIKLPRKWHGVNVVPFPARKRA